MTLPRVRRAVIAAVKLQRVDGVWYEPGNERNPR